MLKLIIAWKSETIYWAFFTKHRTMLLSTTVDSIQSIYYVSYLFLNTVILLFRFYCLVLFTLFLYCLPVFFFTEQEVFLWCPCNTIDYVQLIEAINLNIVPSWTFLLYYASHDRNVRIMSIAEYIYSET